ncbi:MAG: PIN domain-containing protein [Spirochaetes bacterium]|nr:PIN domain-containing protein [Spirochaetota bacterium]
MILLDTDVCIEILRGNKKVIEKRKENNDSIAISFMTAAELYYGAEKSDYREKNKILIEEFLLTVEIIESDIEIMKRFGEIKANLKVKNEILADADILIGSAALEKCEKLITGNENHFKRIDNLRIENWIN